MGKARSLFIVVIAGRYAPALATLAFPAPSSYALFFTPLPVGAAAGATETATCAGVAAVALASVATGFSAGG